MVSAVEQVSGSRSGSGKGGGGGSSSSGTSSTTASYTKTPGEYGGYDGTFRNKLTGQVEGQLSDVMSGKSVPFSQSTIDSLTADAFETTKGQETAALEGADEDAIRRGLGRSGVALANRAAIRGDALKSYASARAQIKREAELKNFEAKMQGLQAAEAWLGQLQQYDLGKEKNSIDRFLGESNIALGYAQVAAQRAAAGAQAGVARSQLEFAREQWEHEKTLEPYKLAAGMLF